MKKFRPTTVDGGRWKAGTVDDGRWGWLYRRRWPVGRLIQSTVAGIVDGGILPASAIVDQRKYNTTSQMILILKVYHNMINVLHCIIINILYIRILYTVFRILHIQNIKWICLYCRGIGSESLAAFLNGVILFF